MRIACVYLPAFYVQLEIMQHPHLEGRPVIISGREGNSVADCSQEAAALGVQPGMTLRDAYYLCPDALSLPFSDRYDSMWARVLFALGTFSLKIEPSVPGLAWLDVTKTMACRDRDERELALAIVRDMECSGLAARIGVGNSRFIAKEAALASWDALVIGQGEEKAFLSFLSIEALPVEEKEKEHLRLLGLTTLKKVARLSRKALTSQFGRSGGTLWEIVNGLDDKRPVPRLQNPICLEREFTSEAPLETSGELQSVISVLVNELADELAEIKMACRKIRLTLNLLDGYSPEKTLVMKKPANDARPILARLADFLERLEVESPVVSFRLSIPDCVPGERDQENLFNRKSLFAERLEGIKAYCNARYGFTPLVKVEESGEQSRLPERRFRFAEV